MVTPGRAQTVIAWAVGALVAACDNNVTIGANLDGGGSEDARLSEDARVSEDAARPPSTFSMLEAGGGDGLYRDPRLVVDHDNVEHVVARTGVGVLHVEWRGDTANIESIGGAASAIALAVDAEDRLHFAQIVSDTCEVQYRVRDHLSWSALESIDDTLDECDSANIDLAVDTTGRPHLAYYDEAQLRVRYATKRSAWEHTGISADARGASWLAIAVDASNRAHIACGGVQVGELQFVSLDEEGAFVSSESIVSSNNHLYGIDLVIDGSDHARVVTAMHPPGANHRLFYAVRGGPGVWSSLFLQDDGEFDAIYPSLAVNAAGASAIGVQQLRDLSAHFLMEPAWEPRRLSPDAISSEVVVAFGDDGRARAAFVQGVDPHLILLRGD